MRKYFNVFVMAQFFNYDKISRYKILAVENDLPQSIYILISKPCYIDFL